MIKRLCFKNIFLVVYYVVLSEHKRVYFFIYSYKAANVEKMIKKLIS